MCIFCWFNVIIIEIAHTIHTFICVEISVTCGKEFFMSKAPTGSSEPDVYFEASFGPASIKPHFHNMHQVLLIREGTVRIQINAKEYVCGPDSVFFISNLESHSIKILEYPYKRYVLSIPVNLPFLNQSPVFGILLQHSESFSHLVSLDGKSAGKFLLLMDDMVRECAEKKSEWQLSIACNITRLLIELFRYSPASFPENSATNMAEIVLDMQKCIAARYFEEISLEALAEKYFVSKYHLSREFKRLAGYNFKEYLILQRISAAKDYLAHSAMPVAEVGAHCGYKNVNHFIRIFRNTVQKTPYQYRKETRSNGIHTEPGQ